MKKIILSLALLLSATFALAQQELQMSHYLFNGLMWNPGYSGSYKYTRLSAMYRHQWTSFPGAPRTGIFTADMPMVHDNMGLALQFVSDHIGVSSLNEIYANYAYQVRLNKKVSLGLGIKAGISVYNARLSDLLVWDEGDVEFDNNIRNMIIPKFGFGAYLHADNFYVGASIPTLWAYDADHELDMNINNSSWLRRHYFFSAAYVFKVSEEFTLKPSTLCKYVRYAPFQGDVNLTLGYKDMAFLTLGYRTNAAAVAMLEIRPFESLRIAYAFDLSTPKYLRVYGGTTHEILIGYDIAPKIAKYKSPRYF
jgi:type IX secretion system PorP/SprF family membrane protein